MDASVVLPWTNHQLREQLQAFDVRSSVPPAEAAAMDPQQRLLLNERRLDDGLTADMLRALENQAGRTWRPHPTPEDTAPREYPTAQFTMRMRHLAHALGFGSDSMAGPLSSKCVTAVWPAALDAAYTSLLALRLQQGSQLSDEYRVWSAIFQAYLETNRTPPSPSTRTTPRSPNLHPHAPGPCCIWDARRRFWNWLSRMSDLLL